MSRSQQWTTAAFEGLARLRSAHAVHALGTALDGTLALTDPHGATVRSLGGPGERPAAVRLSKSVGTPAGLPDLLGIALRVPLEGDAVFDALFAGVGRHDLTRLLLAPSAGWCRRRYTTILPYRVEGRLLLLGLAPEDPGRADSASPEAVREEVERAPLAFAVTEEPLVGPLRVVGRLVLDRVRTGPAISFDPVLNTHPAVHPARPLTALREWAYTGSRRGRRADPVALRTTPQPGDRVATPSGGA